MRGQSLSWLHVIEVVCCDVARGLPDDRFHPVLVGDRPIAIGADHLRSDADGSGEIAADALRAVSLGGVEPLI